MSGLGRWPSALAGILTLFVLVAIPLDLLPLLRGPAPYPPEWQWEYRPAPSGGRWAPALAAAAGLLGLLVLSASPRARRRPCRAAVAVLTAATLLGWGFQLGLLGLEPAGALRTLHARTVSRTITSYHTAALAPEASDPLQLLRRHADLLEEYRTSAKHAATHPPGPVLYYRGWIALCEASPALTRTALGWLGESADRSFRPPNTAASHAAAVWGALVLGLLGAAAAWPIAALAERVSGDALAGARVGVLWGLLPGPALMTPQFDQALALPVAAAAALLASAASGGRLVVKALLAGLCAGVALFISYGAAAFLALGGAIALALDGKGAARALKVAGLSTAAALGVLGLSLLAGHEPLRSALAALAIHREVYTLPRSYTLWLVFNLLDLALFLGLPVAVALGLRAGRSWRSVVRTGAIGAVDLARAVATAGLGLLVASGLTRGEVGRIWIPIMPILLVIAVAEARKAGDGEPGPDLRVSLLLGALLMPLALVIRVYWTL